MSESIVIELSGAPVGKGRPRFVRSTGMAFTPAKTRTYESHLRLAAQDAMGARPPIEGPVRVTMIARLPIPKSWSKRKISEARLGLHRPITKPDVDNYLKLLDAFNQLVFRDDSQIVEATVRKTYSEKPALRIEIEEIANGVVPAHAPLIPFAESFA
jgi:Holliday junction resolvase RusA-like endonuclease